MKEYKDKQELIQSISETYHKYDREFDEIPESSKDHRIEEVDRTPSENLSYQLGWINLLLNWEKDELQGKKVSTPSEEYKWNNLGGLYQSFYQKYGDHTLKEQRELLRESVNAICVWIDTLSDEELFEPEQRDWATTKAKWPLYKWIHINTFAPFTSFRTKIRKWKKLVL